MTHRVTVYSRERCSLCRTAEAVVAEVATPRGVAVEVIDIDTDDELARRYMVRVPVVAVDGVDRFEIEVEPTALAALLDT